MSALLSPAQSISQAALTPPLLIAEEPTGNLDPELSLEIMHLFERFNAFGVTVLIASHDHDRIARLGHRVLSLAAGAARGWLGALRAVEPA